MSQNRDLADGDIIPFDVEISDPGSNFNAWAPWYCYAVPQDGFYM